MSSAIGRNVNRLIFISLGALFFRSLTVLEGIALSSDPNYKVLSSSYPWIARKVLTDKSPKLRSTLQELVYKVSNISLFSRVEKRCLFAGPVTGFRRVFLLFQCFLGILSFRRNWWSNKMRMR